jgi:hypothetical protein
MAETRVESEELAKAIVEDVLDDLAGRSGWEAFWEEIDIPTRREIRRDLTKTVMEARVR